MRAVICKTFPGYTFEMINKLPLNQVIEIYASAEWLAEEEKKMIDKAARRSR
ncbi:MAG: hypothetical protein P9X24_09385 [Candidatus Hatepunaea meridiana]|nr:hypothetical protein [Candidatus Hatepunaea meridiana]